MGIYLFANSKLNNLTKSGINKEFIIQTLGYTPADANTTLPHRKLIVSHEEAGTYSFNTLDNPSVNGRYDIVLIGAGGGGGWVPSSNGAGGGEVLERYGVLMDGEYSFTIGAGGAINEEASGSDGGNTQISSVDNTVLISANGGKGASNSASIFSGFAGGNGGEDGYIANSSNGLISRGGGTRYGLGALYYDDNGSYAYREPTLGGGGAYLLPGADGAIYVYAYVE